MKIINVDINDEIIFKNVLDVDTGVITGISAYVKLPTGNYNNIILNFSFANNKLCDTFKTFASFKINNGTPIVQELVPVEIGGVNYTHTCYIPNEIFEDKCEVTLGVYGYRLNEDETLDKRFSLVPVRNFVIEGSYDPDSTESMVPTPTVFEIYFDKITKAEEDIQDMLEQGNSDIETMLNQCEADYNTFKAEKDAEVNEFLNNAEGQFMGTVNRLEADFEETQTLVNQMETSVNGMQTIVDEIEETNKVVVADVQDLQSMFTHDVLTVNRVSTPKAIKSDIYGGMSSLWQGTCVGNKDGKQHGFALTTNRTIGLESGEPSYSGRLNVWPFTNAGTGDLSVSGLNEALQHTGSDITSAKIQFGMRGNNSSYHIYFTFSLDTPQTPNLRYNASYNKSGFTAEVYFEYSDDQSNWTSIGSKTLPTSASDQFLYINNTNQSHKYWRARFSVAGSSTSYASSTLLLYHLSLTNIDDTSYEYRNDFITSKPFVEGESKRIKAPSNIDLSNVTSNNINGIDFYKLIYPNEEYDLILENNSFKNNIGILKNVSGTLGINASIELSFVPKLILYVFNGNIKAITPNGKTIVNPESATITYCAIY